MNAQVARYIDQVQRRWWVVLLILGAVVLTTAVTADDRPQYVGKALLVQSSPGQSPEQDATMAVGYSTLFNEPSTTTRLRESAQIPDSVEFTASTVAASPILTIEATADDPGVAQTAAQRMAETFREDINSVRRAGYTKELNDTQRQLDSAQSHPQPDGSMNPLVPILQARLDAMRSDGASRLQDLQLRAGVTKTDPKIASQLLSGAVGGGCLGVLAALALGALSRRVVHADDILDKTGVEPLVEIPRGGSASATRLRESGLRVLANHLSVQDLPKSAVVAVTDCRGAATAREISENLARLSAQQGRRTVLVYADNDIDCPATGLGFNDVLANSSLVNDALIDGAVDSLRILPVGTVIADRFSLMSRERIDAVLDELRVDNDHIVIAAPPIAEIIDAAPLFAAADFTLITVEKRRSRFSDVTTAALALGDARAHLLGAVLAEGSGDRPVMVGPRR
ncbi:hypothetical protein [Mycobacterium sp. PSTR-4-N]|uniref:hypothetical protein n=1 Tax=Mycobacterium sp. PSTR-4-N TaxID=2917745 RepID=UPI001F15596F|nr:hypothetical protein [Mycobacterium sp. PSTR-4-N]MCG7595429.1 hypothetical protein [Mycobacterium sp. PSTR-4-N]